MNFLSCIKDGYEWEVHQYDKMLTYSIVCMCFLPLFARVWFKFDL
jgi:hypothetical protein